MDRASTVIVDPDVLASNVEQLVRIVAPAQLCAVVKADAYGHGAHVVGPAALSAGAACLAVATVGEAVRLRRVGVDDPIMLLSEPHPSAWDEVVEWGIEPFVTSAEAIDRIGESARAHHRDVRVHLKIDTGMHRIGAAIADVPRLVEHIARTGGVTLTGLCSHLATAERADTTVLDLQRARFEQATIDAGPFGAGGVRRHLANSAAGLLHPECRYDLVRAGIALYGLSPGGAATAVEEFGLRPVMALRSAVTGVRMVDMGEGVSYGSAPVSGRTVVATLPIGYADGLPRRAGNGHIDVLIRGRRWTTVGVVTMDQTMVVPHPDSGVDRTDPTQVSVGDEVVMIGRQGDDEIRVGELARRLDTIDYEIVAGLRSRMHRAAPSAL